MFVIFSLFVDFQSPLLTDDKIRPLLFPCSRIRKDTLPAKLSAAGVPLEEVICYDTVPHPHFEENMESFLSNVSPGEKVGVVFFSPSGVSFVLDQLVQKCSERDITVQVCEFPGIPNCRESLPVGHYTYLIQGGQ